MSLNKLPEPIWAHLDQDALVSVGLIFSPKCFFVRDSKFYDCLNDLNLKINDYIEQKKVEELKHIVEGMFCLAKYPPTDQYSRVQVCRILHETNETLAEVLFVDIGYSFKITSNSFLTIHPNLIIALPFQVIECSLNGVKDALPSDYELDELTEFMFNLTQDQLLYSMVIKSTSSQNFPGGRCYEVILFDENINVNLEMHAKYSQYFNNILNEISNQLNNVNLIDNHTYEDNEYVNSKELIDQKPLFDINLFDDDVDWDDSIVDHFGLAVFGQDYERMKEHSMRNHDIIKKTNPEIASITPVTSKDLLKGSTYQTNEKAVSVNSEKLKTMVPQKKTKPKSCVNHRSLCLTCNNNVQSRIPDCTWSQNENFIFLRFNILEIDDFSINCTPENIIFKAQFKEISYHFCVKLYGFIIDENVTHKLSYEGFHIKAEKLLKTDYKWPRLCTCNKWHKYIKYDPEHIKPKNASLWLMEMNKFKLLALQIPLPVNEYAETSDNNDNAIFDDESADEYEL